MSNSIFYKRKLFWWICGGPSLCIAFYFFVWATPRYQSVSILRVYKYSISSSGISSVAIGGGSAGAYALKYIIGSWECFHAMDPKALAHEWQKTDFFTRFGGVRTLLSHNQMWLWRYYRAHVYAKIDKYSGMVFLKVDGVDPDFVYHTSQRVISYAKKN